MARIAFHANGLTLRGTEVALYDYAHHNEWMLGNDSLIVVPRISNHHPQAIEKFKSRFQLVHYEDKRELDSILLRERCELFYTIKYGTNDGVVSSAVKTAVHCVFDMSQPHGDVYAAVSDFLSNKFGGLFPVVPHMIDLPNVQENLREELGIPTDAIVFGRHGGFETFDLDFVKGVVREIVQLSPKIYFLFLYTQPFFEHPQVKFLPETADPVRKVRFLNSCDAMLHGRAEGETFGIACGEFSVRNKPVLTFRKSEYTEHLSILGNRALTYESAEELRTLILNFPKPALRNDWDAYSDRFSPNKVMEQFRSIFLEPLGISKRRVPKNIVIGESEAKTFALVANDNLSRNILRGERWEPHITQFFKQFLRPGDCYVDVGASLGFHTVAAAEVVGKQGRVHAFEPQRPVFELLTANCLRNSCNQVRLYHLALSHQRGLVRLSAVNYGEDGVNLGDVHIASSESGGELVRTLPLDSLPLPEKINLVKIDVQGAERFVIEGAKNRLAKDRPFLIVEFEEHCLQRYGYGSGVLFQLIRNLGYEIIYLDYKYPSDHICVPIEKLSEFRAQFQGFLSPLLHSNSLNFNLEHGVREKLLLPGY